MMSALSDADAAIRWLAQLSPDDQGAATDMLAHFVLVSRDEFAQGLTSLLERLAEQSPDSTPFALYAEREVKFSWGHPIRLFKEPDHRPRRASGAAPQPVQPVKAVVPAVGSEGLVANVITELHRKHRHFLSHPSPDVIRRNRVRTIAILTDLVGSGRRVSTYLDSAWRVASVRSWHSYGLIRFVVVA